MSDAARIFNEALALDTTDRARLARDLIDSLDDADGDDTPLPSAELSRRIDEIEAEAASLDTWDVVRARLRAAAGS